MITIQIASDFHIEYKENLSSPDINPDPLDYITPTGDVLVLAGDIGSLYKLKQLHTFLEKLVPHFQAVIYIPGNHEYYIPNTNDKESTTTYLTISVLEKRLKSLAETIPGLYILDRDSIRIGDVCIAGCTLWSSPRCIIPKYIVRIHGMTTEYYTRRHHQDVVYIENISKYCKNKGYKLVMVTHYPPSMKVLEGTNKKTKFHSLYATDLENTMVTKEKGIETWICGHIHKNFDFITDGKSRLLGNQRGKPRDKIADYKKDFILTFL